MTDKENKETVYGDNSDYLELKDPFVLDERLKVTTIGDEVLFLEEGNIYIRQVWGARVKDGVYEVKVLGANGGWKRGFYKLASE